jgi:hypothetical protein
VDPVGGGHRTALVCLCSNLKGLLSPDSENYGGGGKWEGGQRTVDGGDRDVCDTLLTSDLVDPSYRESS